jgi:hypothetical protein
MLNKLVTLSQPPTNLDQVGNTPLVKAANFGRMLSEGGRALIPKGEGKGRGANLIGK